MSEHPPTTPSMLLPSWVLTGLNGTPTRFVLDRMRACTQVYADTSNGGTDAPYLYLSGFRGADGSSGLPAVSMNASLAVESSVISNEITFVYTVEHGDNSTSAALEVDGRVAIRDGDAPLVDLLGREANVTLPGMGSEDSLSATSSVSIDTAEPVVVAVGSLLEGGEYGVGQVRDKGRR